jgi:hypothetical protein
MQKKRMRYASKQDEELINKMGKLIGCQSESKCEKYYKELSVLRCDFYERLTREKCVGIELDHDLAVELFEQALDSNNMSTAFHVFFLANQLSASCNVEHHPSRSLDYFMQLCLLINQPVRAVYVMKFIDYLYRTQWIDERRYVDLIKIRHHISDWKCVNNQFIRCFSPKFFDTIYYSEVKEVIAYVLEAKAAQIKRENQPMTVLQALICESVNSMNPLIDVIKKLAAYDIELLRELDGEGRDIYFYLEQVKAKAKGKEVELAIQFVKKELYFSKFGFLLFSRNSPIVTELTEDVQRQIAKITIYTRQ